jgi:hypothetical protein
LSTAACTDTSSAEVGSSATRRVAVYLADRGRDLVRRLDEQAIEHQGRIEAAYGVQRTGRLMRELGRLVESLS